MGLDIYVMPLWRYLVGDFESVFEKNALVLGMAGKAKVVTTFGILSPTTFRQRFRGWSAKRRVRGFTKLVELANGRPIQWNDEGPVVYAEQCFGMQPLRVYAKWLDYRDTFKSFETEPPAGDWYKHPVWRLNDGRSLTCPHLIDSDCYSGYFLPCDFERITKIEEFQVHSWTFHRQAASSFRLRDELERLNEHLGVTDQYTTDQHQRDSLWRVKDSFRQMKTVMNLSIEHELPIIFCG